MVSSPFPERLPARLPEPSAHEPPDGGALDDLIGHVRRLRDGVESARRGESADGARHRQRRAAWDLAVRHLEDFGSQLARLRAAAPGGGLCRTGGPVGSAEWNLLTGEAAWSEELFALFGRPVREGPLTLDQLPDWLPPEDQPALRTAVAGCLVDGRPMVCEFRVARPDGSLRTVRMAGEPVLDEGGGTVAMWALVGEVDEPRRAAPAPPGSGARAAPRHRRGAARVADRVAVEHQEAVPAPWPATADLGPQRGARGSLEVAAGYLPERATAARGGRWYDTLELREGLVLTVGDLAGRGPATAAGAAMALGALRGIAVTGASPGVLLAYLSELLDRDTHPVLGSALCCRYEPGRRRLTWAQAGHPAPLLCRAAPGSAASGRALPRPAGPPLGTVTGAQYEERADPLEPGDVLVLHTEGLLSASPPAHAGERRLLDLAPRLTAADSARACLRLIAEACETTDREDDACVLVARVRP